MNYPAIDPIIFCIGPLCIRWYGLMYVLGFIASFYLVKQQIREFGYTALEKHFDNLNMVLILGVVIGGRLGYVFFYNWGYYKHHLLEIPATWNGGMSFHGACLALIIGGWLFCRITRLNFWQTADIYIVTIPIGLGLGRIGNFVNGELFGRVTTSPLGMVFPMGGSLPRHPSQLYEAVLEGLLLFILLWSVHKKPWKNQQRWPHGSMLCLFLSGYGICRIIVENFRQPDAQLGFLIAHLTMGQLLSSVMVAGSIFLWGWLRKKAQLPA